MILHCTLLVDLDYLELLLISIKTETVRYSYIHWLQVM